MDLSGMKIGVFRKDVEVIRQNPLMLFDRQADAYYRISERAAVLISCMTEATTTGEFCSRMERRGFHVTLEEVINLLSFLKQNDLLEPEYSQTAVRQQKLREAKEKSRFLRMASAYMYFRLPPWHPEEFFRNIAPYVSFLASKAFIILLMIPAVAGFLLAIRNFNTVRTVFLDSLSWAGIAKYFAAIVLLKIIHEAAHSLAAIRFNCRVRGIGLGFMLFYPRLYTDTTDSWRLERKERLLIDAAGIIAELLIGGIAALAYFYLPPGALQATLFYIFAVSTLSTLLVNGNPCIRYDGYYILCDLTGIDNLMTRSAETVKQFWRYYLLRLGTKPEQNNRFFLLFFGICSCIYRIFLYTSIILVIYHKFVKVVAVVLLILEIYTILIYPCIREIRTIRELSRKSAAKARGFLLLAVLAAAALVLFMPLHWELELYGEVVPEERYPVTVSESGYFTGDLPAHSYRVSAGETLFTLRSPQLSFAQEKLQALLRQDKMQFAQESTDEKLFSRSGITAKKIASDQQAAEELFRRQEKLSIKAPADGIFTVAKADLFRAGRFVPKGSVIGEVVSSGLMVYAYAEDRDIGTISPGTPAKIRTVDSLKEYDAVVTRVDPVALPLENSPLFILYGGRIPMYQNSGEPGKFHSVRPLCRVELIFTGKEIPASGRRVFCDIKERRQLYTLLVRSALSIFRREF